MKGILIENKQGKFEDIVKVVDFNTTHVGVEYENSLQYHVEGFIEAVNSKILDKVISGASSLIINEEGKLEKKAINPIGTFLYLCDSKGYMDMNLMQFDVIVGKTLIVAVGNTPEGMDFIGLDEKQIDSTLKQLAEVYKWTLKYKW